MERITRTDIYSAAMSEVTTQTKRTVGNIFRNTSTIYIKCSTEDTYTATDFTFIYTDLAPIQIKGTICTVVSACTNNYTTSTNIIFRCIFGYLSTVHIKCTAPNINRSSHLVTCMGDFTLCISCLTVCKREMMFNIYRIYITIIIFIDFLCFINSTFLRILHCNAVSVQTEYCIIRSNPSITCVTVIICNISI